MLPKWRCPRTRSFTRAFVVYRCRTNPKHSHKVKAKATEITEGGWVITFDQYEECPTCWQDVGAFAPAFCSVAGIEVGGSWRRRLTRYLK